MTMADASKEPEVSSTSANSNEKPAVLIIGGLGTCMLSHLSSPPTS